jgi:MFS family permease
VAAATTVTKLPVFLLAAFAVLVRDNVSVTVTQLGAVAAIFFASTALVSIPGGLLAHRIGARPTLRLAVTVTAVSLGGAALAQTWWQIAALMALAGAANGSSEPAANLAIAVGVGRSRQGIAFGIKQSAAPMTTLLAGFSLPLLGVTLGWRWTFALGAILSLAAMFMVPRISTPATDRTALDDSRRGSPTSALLVLACAFGCGTAAATATASFLVATAVEDGYGLGAAGVLLAVSSALAIITRGVAGWSADRRVGRHLPVVACMLALGGVGLGLLTIGSVAATAVGAGLAFAFGWGWTGLLVFAVARLNIDRAATATSLLLLGGAAGAAVGPLAFGVVVDLVSFRSAWALAAATCVLAAALCMAGRRMIVMDLASRS